jgi:hypothetical protein
MRCQQPTSEPLKISSWLCTELSSEADHLATPNTSRQLGRLRSTWVSLARDLSADVPGRVVGPGRGR